ncbi:MAG: endonuclease domain-containing protein [Alphaproteobacteria bacterium]|nr:endonuclease domain-containing protein [Alphaproteobacteria bacterium]
MQASFPNLSLQGDSALHPNLPLEGGGTEGVKTKSLNNFCRHNRKNKTPAEQKLWSILRANKLGVHFRQQHQIGQYLVDFVCLKKKLIIECDGGQHNEKADAKKTHFLENEGYVVLRFWNNEVLANVEGCAVKILEFLHPLQTSPLKGEDKLKGAIKIRMDYS